MSKKNVNKKENPPKMGDSFKGLPQKATRKRYVDKKGIKRTFYVNEKGRRVSEKVWRQVKTAQKEFSPVKRKKKPKIIKLGSDALHHKSFLSYVKNKIFKEDWKMNFRNSEFGALGSFWFFLGQKKMYEAFLNNIDSGGKDKDSVSPDVLHSFSFDIANNVIYYSLSDVFFVPQKFAPKNLDSFFK